MHVLAAMRAEESVAKDMMKGGLRLYGMGPQNDSHNYYLLMG
jgi:hypothetical protein